MGTFKFVYTYALSTASARVADAVKTMNQLIALNDIENVTYTYLDSLADKIKMSKPSIQRHIATLRDEGIIIPHEDNHLHAKSITRWRIVPWLAWKGTAKQLDKYLSSLPTNHKFWEYADPEFFEALKDEIRKERLNTDIEL